MTAIILATASLAIWLYLLFGRGSFWRGRERDDGATLPAATRWPGVIAIVPARNEADVVAESIASLLRQRYRGALSVLLVDDGSTDGTAEIALRAAAQGGHRLDILRGSNLPPGWTGKLWAMHTGVRHIETTAAPAELILFTDADIAYRAPDAVENLVRNALARGSVLTSLMVKLRCESLAERALVPAFIFFFAKLYPFAWVNDLGRGTAAAAGGCMLVRRDALARAGGVEAIRSALIDDCALGAAMKRQGPIWLGLTERVVSLRKYPEYNDIRRMVVRSAYAELRYSPWLLAGAVLGMALTYLAPPLLATSATGIAQLLGILAWLAAALSFVPTLRFYGRSLLWAPALLAIAAVYMLFTIESAIQHWRGCGGAWKGRFQAAGTRGSFPS